MAEEAGDRIERDEPLFEISTDKVDTEIPSPAAGTLAEVLVEEGKTVGINTVVARIDEGGAAAAAPPDKPAEKPAEQPAPVAAAPPPAPAPTPAPAPAPVAAAEEVAEPAGPLSPLVRKIARENNLDLGKVTGTGAGGRITKQDVEAYMAQAPAAPAPTPAPAAPPAAPAFQPAASGGAPKTRVEPLSQMRIKIASTW